MEARRARRGVELVQVIGLHPRRQHGAEQCFQRLGAVVDATQQHRLAKYRNRLSLDAADRGARLGGEFARVVGVQHQPHRLVGGERGGQASVIIDWIGGRHPRVDAQELDVRDR